MHQMTLTIFFVCWVIANIIVNIRERDRICSVIFNHDGFHYVTCSLYNLLYHSKSCLDYFRATFATHMYVFCFLKTFMIKNCQKYKTPFSYIAITQLNKEHG